MSRILVTGSTGFLGAALAERLRAEDVCVRTTGRRGDRDLAVDHWPLDLRHSPELPELLTGVSTVIHCAGLAHQFSSRKNESEYFDVNCEATERLARVAEAKGVRRFVFLSSVSVYGPAENSQPRDENARTNPQGAYAASKRKAEVRLLRIAAETRMQVFILRMTTLYGPSDPGNVGRLAEAIGRGRFLMVGPGTNHKSLLHRDDAASACVKAALTPLDRPAGIWNVAGGYAPMQDIVTNLANAQGQKPPARHFPAAIASGLLWGGSIFGVGRIRSWARARRLTLKKWLAEDSYDASHFRQDFNWQPKVALEDGLSQMVKEQPNNNDGTVRRAA